MKLRLLSRSVRARNYVRNNLQNRRFYFTRVRHYNIGRTFPRTLWRMCDLCVGAYYTPIAVRRGRDFDAVDLSNIPSIVMDS